MQKHVMPGVGVFCHLVTGYGHRRTLKSILGELPLTNQRPTGAPHTAESVSRVVLFAVVPMYLTSMLEEDVELGIQVAAKAAVSASSNL